MAIVSNGLRVDSQWDKAKFLRVTEEHNLTHHGVDGLFDSV